MNHGHQETKPAGRTTAYAAFSKGWDVGNGSSLCWVLGRLSCSGRAGQEPFGASQSGAVLCEGRCSYSSQLASRMYVLLAYPQSLLISLLPVSVSSKLTNCRSVALVSHWRDWKQGLSLVAASRAP